LWDADYPWYVRTQKVCSALMDAGHEVHIVARNRAWAPSVEKLPEGTVHRMPAWKWTGKRVDNQLSFPAFFSPRWIRHLRNVAQRVRADVIIARDLPLCPTAIHVGRKLGLPVIFDMAENYPAMMQEIWDAGRQGKLDVFLRNPRMVAAVERWTLPRVDGTMVVVRESGDRLQALGVSPEKIAVVSNTPPRSRVTPNWDAKHRTGGPLQLVYLGLMELPRGVGEVLEAVALLRDRGVAVQLKLIGNGRDFDLLKQKAATLKLTTPHVDFLGRLDHAAALKVVSHAQVGLVPHHADEAWNTTIPNKLFDYMAAGLAVVSSNAAPPTRIINETGAGLVFDSGNAVSLADALFKLQDVNVRLQHGAAGRAAVQSKYNWENDVDCMLAMLEKLTAGASPMQVATPMTGPAKNRVYA
jgi:glycosyltransferase involved in cell wall biosynthesis